MKSLILLAINFFILAPAFASSGVEFKGHWQGKGTHQFLSNLADCDFDIKIFRICDSTPCEANPKIQISQENTQCVPRDSSYPIYTYPNSLWAYFRIEGNRVVDVNSKEVVGRYAEGTIALDYLGRNDNSRFWLELNQDGSCSFHQTAIFNPWENKANIYSAILNRVN